MADMQDALDALDALSDEDENDMAVTASDDQSFRIPSGKYKGLVRQKITGVKASYFDKVMALKEEIVNDPEFQRRASTIAKTYAELRREAEQKAAELADLNLRLQAVTLLMIDQFESEGERGLTLKNGDKIRWQPEPHLVVLDSDQFRVWCLSNGLERELKLPWAKANKLVKDLLVAGEPEPPGTECFIRPKVIFTKG